jgi:hypothetical protein
MKRAWFGAGLLVLVTACGESAGTLEVTLDSTVPTITNKTTVAITGTVHRTPTIKTTYIVKIAKGLVTAADTVDSTGRFNVAMTLDKDTSNQFTVSATDEQGSTGPTVTVLVTHDDQPPTVAAVTPNFEADLVARSQTVSFTLSEPVVSPGVDVGMFHGGARVTGTLTMGSDGVNGTFVPAGQLAPNSIYTLLFTGMQDAAGNTDTVFSCFTTSGAATVVTDTSVGGFKAGTPPAALVPPDMQEARWVVNAGALNGVVRFAARSSFFLADTNNVSVWVDLDIDQNPSTGFKAYRDSALAGLGPAYASGLGVEYVIGMFAADSSGVADVFAAHYVGVLQIDPSSAYTFLPDVCGHFFGFSVPLSALGNDDGQMDFSLFAISEAPTGDEYADAFPLRGKSSFAGAPPSLARSPLAARPLRSRATTSPRAVWPFHGTRPRPAPRTGDLPAPSRAWVRVGSR